MLKDLRDVEALSELGVLFLLFEQGLELSLDRLKVGGTGEAAGFRHVSQGSSRVWIADQRGPRRAARR
jgi:hypothetical protein